VINYIAEDLDKLGLKDAVHYLDGKPEGIKEEALGLYLLEVLKLQQKEIDRLKELLGEGKKDKPDPTLRKSKRSSKGEETTKKGG